MHRRLSRLVALVVFALAALISFASPALAGGALNEGTCVQGDSGGAGARVCTPWD